MRVRIPKTLRELASEPIEGVVCGSCGERTATIYPWPEPTGTCVCPCVTPAWLVEFVRASSARMSAVTDEFRARSERAFGRSGFDVTDPRLDAPDGAVVDGFERVGDRWVPA